MDIVKLNTGRDFAVAAAITLQIGFDKCYLKQTKLLTLLGGNIVARYQVFIVYFHYNCVY